MTLLALVAFRCPRDIKEYTFIGVGFRLNNVVVFLDIHFDLSAGRNIVFGWLRNYYFLSSAWANWLHNCAHSKRRCDWLYTLFANFLLLHLILPLLFVLILLILFHFILYLIFGLAVQIRLVRRVKSIHIFWVLNIHHVIYSLRNFYRLDIRVLLRLQISLFINFILILILKIKMMSLTQWRSGRFWQ